MANIRARAPLALFLVSATCFVSREARADVREEPSASRGAAFDANIGLRTGISPALLVPSEGGPLGVGVDVEARYGIEVGPTILAPGARLGGDYISERFVGMAMPEARLTLPLGPLAPYAIGGVGGGWVSNRAESGVSVLAGGGLTIHFSRRFAIGASATYETITTTGFHVFALSPELSIGL